MSETQIAPEKNATNENATDKNKGSANSNEISADAMFQAKSNALIAQYTSLRAEQVELVKTQSQMYNYTLIVIGAAVSGLITVLIKSELNAFDIYIFIYWVLLFLPAIFAQIAFLFFDQEIMIHANGSYIFYVLRKKFYLLVSGIDDKDPDDNHFKEAMQPGEITSENISYKHNDINNPYFGSITHFKYLNFTTHYFHNRLYKLRWFLFYLLSALPTILFPIYIGIGFRAGYLEWTANLTLAWKCYNFASIVIYFCNWYLILQLGQIIVYLKLRDLNQTKISVPEHNRHHKILSERLTHLGFWGSIKRHFRPKKTYERIFEELVIEPALSPPDDNLSSEIIVAVTGSDTKEMSNKSKKQIQNIRGNKRRR